VRSPASRNVQAKNVNERIYPLLDEVVEGYLEIVLQHGF
jgi:hypothetical protein